MAQVEGSRTFAGPASAYDSFMGRYSRALAGGFADFWLPKPSEAAGRVLDVGCGPGALTEVLATRLGAERVAGIDPTPGFVEAARARLKGVEVHVAPAERIPFADDTFDAAAAQLVLHFVSDAARAAGEMARVVRPGGPVAAAVWDFDEGMTMLRAFWDAALSLDSGAPDEARVLRFGRPGEIAGLFADAGLAEIEETTLTVSSRYRSFEELWSGFGHGIGPAGAYAAGLGARERQRLAEALYERLGRPEGPFALTAVARAARARVPLAAG